MLLLKKVKHYTKCRYKVNHNIRALFSCMANYDNVCMIYVCLSINFANLVNQSGIDQSVDNVNAI